MKERTATKITYKRLLISGLVPAALAGIVAVAAVKAIGGNTGLFNGDSGGNCGPANGGA